MNKAQKNNQESLRPTNERGPHTHFPQTIGEHAKHERLKRNVAPFIHLPKGEPLPAAAVELADFLKPFWGGDYGAEMWKLYKRWTRPYHADEPMLKAEAQRTGISLDEYISRTALKRIQEYVEKRPRLKVLLPGQSQTSSVSIDSTRPASGTVGKGIGKEALALACLVQHVDWTNAQIARHIGCHSQSLYRMKNFQAARKAQRRGGPDLPRGYKDSKGNIDAKM